MNSSKFTVFVVDDDPSVLKALGRLVRSAGLEVELFASPEDFLNRYDQNVPGCLILDVAMPNITGLEMHQTLIEKGSELPVIFLTGHGDIPMSVRAIKQGAIDFFTKPLNDNELISAIHNAQEKDEFARKARAQLNELQQRLASLTPRELEVLSHVVSGKRNKQIADDLGIVEKTIKVHRSNIMEKLKVQSLADLVKLSEKLGVNSYPR
jgi:RNA polymerase sigma factor (sigma-70 family)